MLAAGTGCSWAWGLPQLPKALRVVVVSSEPGFEAGDEWSSLQVGGPSGKVSNIADILSHLYQGLTSGELQNDSAFFPFTSVFFLNCVYSRAWVLETHQFFPLAVFPAQTAGC